MFRHLKSGFLLAIVALAALLTPGMPALAAWDVPSYWPNYNTALNYDLSDATGVTKLTFIFPSAYSNTLGGVWGRGAPGSCVNDWQFWGTGGLLYYGNFWDCNGSNDWFDAMGSHGGAIVMPRTITSQGYTGTFTYVITRVPYLSPTTIGNITNSIVTITVVATQTTLNGESALMITSDDGTNSGETIWLVNCITRDTGGCAKGVRRHQGRSFGVINYDVTFTTWVTK